MWLNHSARQISLSVKREDLTKEQLADAIQLEKMGLLEKVDKSLSILEAAENEEQMCEMPDEFEEFEQFTKMFHADEILTPKSKKIKTAPQMNSVTWTTPLGLPIVQPYYKDNTTEISTHLQTFRVVETEKRLPVSLQKQSSAFPPNFVHSLDASHMMLSAVACQSKNICFAAVHDSYWSHPSDVDEMNGLLRESFVQLHSQNIMQRLEKEFYTRYDGMRIPTQVVLKQTDIEAWNKYLIENNRKPISAKVTKKLTSFIAFSLKPLPKSGELDVSVVRDSVYFFH